MEENRDRGMEGGHASTWSGTDYSGKSLAKAAGPGGVQFTSDLSAIGEVGGSGAENIFRPDQTNVLDEERRLIDKVFGIVDKENKGQIGVADLEDMFKLYGVDTHFLASAVERVMSNADKDRDGMISPGEFYMLLSLKFSKGDSVKEMEDVFERMGARPASASTNRTEPQMEIGIEELHKVAQMLGENDMSKPEIKDMIRCFKRLAEPILNPAIETGGGYGQQRPAVVSTSDKKKKSKNSKLRLPEQSFTEKDITDTANILYMNEFIAMMEMEL